MDIGEQRRVIIVEPEPITAPTEEPSPQWERPAEAPMEPEREPARKG